MSDSDGYIDWLSAWLFWVNDKCPREQLNSRTPKKSSFDTYLYWTVWWLNTISYVNTVHMYMVRNNDRARAALKWT